jgi:hypothetical protein
LALKNGMKVKQPSTGSTVVQARLVREVARVTAEREQIWAELQESDDDYERRMACGAPVKRVLARCERLSQRHGVLERRRRELAAQLPPLRLATNDDF